MKKFLLPVLMLLTVASCSKFDDSSIWEELKEHENRILKLETLCSQMNTNITSLQTIVAALQENDYVKNIAPITENGKEIGYTITFAKKGSITIYHGKNGEDGKDGVNGTDGTNGKDGVDGKDGQTPVIGVRKHTDGIYYWTLNGEWLLDDAGNKIPTTGKDGQDGEDGKDGQNGTNGSDGKDGVDGEDGQDGANGKDGITPQLKIEEDYWYISYDNGESWKKLGKATGNNVLDGSDGESIIKLITEDEDNVYFNLSDGTLLTLPKRNSDIIVFEDLAVKAICCRNWDTNLDGELSYKEAAAVTSITKAFKGSNIIAFTEFQYFTGISSVSTSAFENCNSLWKISIPIQVKSIDDKAFLCCWNLPQINIPNGVEDIKESAFYGCSGLSDIVFPSSLTMIGKQAFYLCSGLTRIVVPDNVVSIGDSAFGYCYSVTYTYIGSGIREIASSAFSYGPAGELIYASLIPKGYDGTGSTYFLSDTNFTKIVIGGKAVKIGDYAFSYGVDDVVTVVIEECVKIIGSYAMRDMFSLKYIYCKSATPPSCGSSIFPSSLSKIYVPIGSADAYKQAWAVYSNKIEEFDFENNTI